VEGDAPSDEELVRRIVAGEASLFATLMRRYNQRLFRVVRGIVRSPSDAEDIVQQAYLSAYAHLTQFEGRARFSTWLTRIAVHEAMARVRFRQRRDLPLEDATRAADDCERDPEQQASERELARRLEEACDSLPDIYRSVFVMRGIEEMSIAETAACLDLSEEAIKVRYHRARALIRALVDDQVGEAAREAYSFLGAQCRGMVTRVASRLGWTPVAP
jgi:RNA polymerase sigma-70 factor (ECF subfamily)